MKNNKYKPFFSIITCTKNSEDFLENNLNSVEIQTFKNFEQIIIDGKSLDKTIKIIKNYNLGNSHVVKTYLAAPKGIANAFNLGIRHANGIYLFFLNSDDYFYDENVLKDVHDFLVKNKNINWIYGKINVIEENGKRIGIFPKYEIFKHKFPFLLKFFNYIPHQAVFIKFDVFNKYGLFDEKLSSLMDYDFWLRIAKGTKWTFFERIISNYSIRKGAQSSSKKNKNINYKNVICVQKRHLKGCELFFARFINDILSAKYRFLR